MKNLEVRILEHNLYTNFPKFLAMLTQRGHQISNMKDLEILWVKSKTGMPNEKLIKLPHTTIQRMNHVVVAIVGLSTKALTQFRTHAKRVTCISTSTQYSEYSGRDNNYILPFDEELYAGLAEDMQKAYKKVHEEYKTLIARGVDKDIAGYLLPQGLRKAFIMCANIDDWRYILKTRLCHRNTVETQVIARLIYDEIKTIDPVWVIGCLPECAYTKCVEGHFCCGKKIKKEDYET